LPTARREEDDSGTEKVDYYFRQQDLFSSTVRINRITLTFSRFDFFCYQFRIGDRDEFLFFPERIMPDSFSTSSSLTADFDTAPWNERDETGTAKYRSRKDSRGSWVEKMCTIMQAEPQPRRQTQRPRRRAAEAGPELKSQAADASRSKLVSGLSGSVTGAMANTGVFSDTSQPGRTAFKAVNRQHFREFWLNIMAQCAQK
jgi:hypothetical protein